MYHFFSTTAPTQILDRLPTTKYYSRTPLNPYLSVDGLGYGLLEVMGYEGSILGFAAAEKYGL